ncbi:MAG: hypothetical protein R3A52_01155 [Polyangiales bacterium]
MNCSRCNKPTFAGCGMHVEQVLGDVPPANRCRCNEEASDAAASGQPRPWWRDLLGR